MTKKPRITISLTDQQYFYLKTISECSGDSMSKTIGEILEVSMPTLEAMASTMKHVESMKYNELNKVAEIFIKTVDKLDMFHSAVNGSMDTLKDEVDKLGKTKNPNSTNRGVVSTKKRPKKGQKSSKTPIRLVKRTKRTAKGAK